MTLKQTYLLLIILFWSIQVKAQNEQYSKVKIFTNQVGIQSLNQSGLFIDHGVFVSNNEFITDLSNNEIVALQNSGMSYEIIIQDVSEFYKNRLTKTVAPQNKSGSCNISQNQISTPTHFTFGSMGGYLTYEEFESALDQMKIAYPNLISTKAPITGYQSWENRPIYWIRISDNAQTDETEPEVLYGSMIHAREPVALMQMLFYMWYILENYNTNQEIKYLLDNTELYFIPMINPDGYYHNQITNPGGGGMWRKNMCNNGDGSYGVDLNRNFSYQWGGLGASSVPSAGTYRGISAFSEPESKAYRDFVNTKQIQFALSHHTYGNDLLFPFSYDAVQTPDNTYFMDLTDYMVRENGFISMQSSSLYPSSGDTDDWSYGDVSQKPKIFAMTVETGAASEGFWPAQTSIIPLSAANVQLNLDIARFVHNYASIKDLSPNFINTNSGYIAFDLHKYGLLTGDFTVSLTPLSSEIISTGNPKLYTGVNPMDSQIDSISFLLNGAVVQGTGLKFVLSLDNGSFVYRDTLYKVFGSPNVIFSDNSDQFSNWTSSSWNITNEKYFSPSQSITDSPNSSYSNNTTSTLYMNDEIDLTLAFFAKLNFYATWDIEQGYDYVQVRASDDGGINWTALCGNYTHPGNGNQANAEPVYDGLQSDWVLEEMDLSPFFGKKIKLSFVLVADPDVNADGFYFDDLKVSILNGFAGLEDNLNSNHFISELYPNPSLGITNFLLAPNQKDVRIEIFDTKGNMVHQEQGLNEGEQTMNLNHLKGGMYVCKFIFKDASTEYKKLCIVSK